MDDATARTLFERQPLSGDDATRLAKHILKTGSVLFWRHALDEMAKDHLTTVDATNVLRAGFISEPAEFEKDSWRYRMRTARLVDVIQFESASELSVVTVWRITR